ncbi:MAG: hypothetical protein IKJ94_07030 [Oscillospiraceae bacterium]|nr:hypothetical protein [Oscillospiraceae bacterium]
MRYLIVTYDDYFNVPYIRYYEDFLKAKNHTYDIVLWNRSGQVVDIPNAFVFNGRDRSSKLGKILPFLQWRRFVKRILKKQAYDRLIILTTLPAILLSDVLLKEYPGRYWLDIRDFTYENLGFYKKLVETLVDSASAVSISSPAFQSFLPQREHIYLTHNISNQDAAAEVCTLDTRRSRFCIGFVGGIQFKEQNQLLLRQFANNEKYLLKYVGKAHLGCDLSPFCKENGIENAEFHPAFRNEEKPQIYQDIDLINCVYGNNNQVVKLLLPNRLYDCILFKKPILVSKNTYLEEVVQEYNLGIAVDPEQENVVAQVDAYLEAFDRESFQEGCRSFLDRVNREITNYTRALEAFCDTNAPKDF